MDESSQSALTRLANLWPGALGHIHQFGRDGALTISITNYQESDDTRATFTGVTFLRVSRSWLGHTLSVRTDSTTGQYILDDPDGGFALRLQSVSLIPWERPHWLKRPSLSAEEETTLKFYAARQLHIAPEVVAELSRDLATIHDRHATLIAYTFSLSTVTLELSAEGSAPLHLMCRMPIEYRGPTRWRIGRLQAELNDPPTTMRITDTIAGVSITCYGANLQRR